MFIPAWIFDKRTYRTLKNRFTNRRF